MARTKANTAIASACRGVLRVWEALQVELHGKYSVERMLRLKRYSESTSLWRVLLVTATTFIPCITIALLIDCIPLQPPSAGLEHSHMFWLRGFLMASCIHVAVLVQLREFVRQFPITRLQIACISIFNGAAGTAFSIAMAWRVGFPLPFTIAVASPVCIVGLASFAGLGWGRFLVRHPAVRADLLRYSLMVATQLSLIYVYPSFSYIFSNLSPTGQSVFSLFLPLPKLLFKNCICYIVRNQEDFKPQVAILNIEIFHALFVTLSMQTATSPQTIVIMMAVDAVQSWVSLHDVNVLVKRLDLLLTKARLRCSESASHGTCCRGPQLAASIETAGMRTPGAVPSVVEIARFILEVDKSVGQDTSIQLLSDVTSQNAASSSVGASIVPEESLGALQLSKLCWSTDSRSQVHALDSARTSIPDADKCAIQGMSDADRLEFVQHTLQLLHLTEFMLLVEFTEVVIPVGYSLYLLVAFQMPNHVYSAQLKNVDQAQLLRNVFTTLVYASLELVSFLVLAQLLWRKLKISPIHQLTFVLETQWRLAQSKLVLWVVFTVQIAVDHFGSDYSFRFAWLHQKPS